MINGVIDRDGNTWTVQEALDKSLEIGFPKSFITAAVKYGNRKWNGKPHPTDIVNCPRQAALKYTEDYPIYLDKTVDSMIGTSMHRFFVTGDEVYANVKVENDIMNGELDLIEVVDGSLILYDFKVVKSYPVKKALGFYTDKETVLDEDGEPVRFKSGKRKGEIKTRNVTKQDYAKRDVKAYTRQLNIYRYLYETGSISNMPGIYSDNKIHEMFIFQLLKEAGRIAAENGIIHSSYRVPIPKVDLDLVKDFIEEKSIPIYVYLENNGPLPPIPTDPDDVWEGRLCTGFCPVAHICNKDGKNPYLTQTEDEE